MEKNGFCICIQRTKNYKRRCNREKLEREKENKNLLHGVIKKVKTTDKIFIYFYEF